MVGLEEIKNAIRDREKEMEERIITELIVQRETDIKDKITKDVALIITGVRRCGKSTLSFISAKGQSFAYINFDDERLDISASELNKVLESVYSLKGDVDLLIFDEIQNIPGWEKFVSRLVGTKKIIITGSNANLLSKELATHLTGRHIDSVLFPFSFNEYLSYKNITPDIHLTKDIAIIKKALDEYIEKGGFPLSYKIGNLFLIETYKDIIERDIIQRYKIRHSASLKELAKYLITNSSKEITYNKLKNIFSIKSTQTVMNYAEYLKNTYLIFILERFSFKLKERKLAPKKTYSIDTGIINVISSQNSKNKGALMENLIATQLLRKKEKAPFTELYYYKDHQQREVDFLIKENNKITQLIQSSYSLSDIKTKEREINSLLKASKELNCKNLLIITWEYEGLEEHKGKKIKFTPLWKWLLSENTS